MLPAGDDGALRLLVSIADASAFVPEGSALDRAARARATSVYLAGQVLQMLPDALSSAWISLLPDQDRWCLTVEMRIDPQGKILAADVYESVIRSWARLDYTETVAFLEHGVLSPAMDRLRDVMPWFRTASARLAVARARRGGVVLSRDEARVTFDRDKETPSGIERVHTNAAHTMIERFMVAANEAIATWLHARGVPAPYRVHAAPEPARVKDLAAFARHCGVLAGFGPALTPLALAAFDAQIAGCPSEEALRSVLRGVLGPARYTVHPSIHFGLAAPLYLHFTSPIRRYADLVGAPAAQAVPPRRPPVRGRRPAGGGPVAPHQRARAHRRPGRGGAAADARGVVPGAAPRRGPRRPRHARASVRAPGPARRERRRGAAPLRGDPGGPYRVDVRETDARSATRTFTVGVPLRVTIAAADPVLGRVELGWVSEG